ncbi:MAG: hypothetical protein K0R28_145 [Paenibacillus sp.]|jgi:hypothetical protein|nr:hypothetical protein [Paenibacillus sp.]
MAFVRKSWIAFLALLIAAPVLLFGSLGLPRLAAAASLLSDNFEDGNTGGWTFPEGLAATWSVAAGGGTSWLKNSDTAAASKIAATGPIYAQDYTYEIDIKTDHDTANSLPSAIFRYQNVNNFYMLQMRFSDNLVRLFKRVNGVYSQIGSDAATALVAGQTYKVKVVVAGSSINTYVDGVAKIAVTDTTFTGGAVGVRAYGGVQYYDNVSIMTSDTGYPVLLDDTFEDGNASGWTYPEGSPATWSASLSEDLYWLKNSDTAPVSKIAVNGNTAWTDYTYFIDIKSEADSANSYPSAIFRYQDVNNFYMIQLRYGADTVRLYKRAGGTYTQLGSDIATPLAAGRNYAVKIEVNGSSIRTYINGDLKLAITDSTFASGSIGVRAYGEIQYFDNTLVTAGVLPQPIASPSTVADYYVATNGSDSNSGTSVSAPLLTIQKAVEKVRADKAANPNRDYKVLIRGGTYYLESPITLDSGDGAADGYSIVYAGYPGDPLPVISGGVPLTGTWVAHSDPDRSNMWKLPIAALGSGSWYFRQLFVDGARATRSREPDAADGNGFYTVGAISNGRKTVQTPQDLPNGWTASVRTTSGGSGYTEGAELASTAWWHFNRQYVSAVDGAANTITTINNIGSDMSSFVISTGSHSRLWLENDYQFIDTAGEWYADNVDGYLYYKAASGANPNAMSFVASKLTTLLQVTGTASAPVKNVVFYGLSFQHTDWTLSHANERLGVQGGWGQTWNSTTKTATYYPAGAVRFQYVASSLIQNSDFRKLGDGAVAFEEGSHLNRIERNLFTDVGSSSIQISRGKDGIASLHPLNYAYGSVYDYNIGNRITNNTFTDTGVVDYGANGIGVGYAHHTTIDHNRLDGNGFTSIGLLSALATLSTPAHHNIVSWNEVANDGSASPNKMKINQDYGGIYSYGIQLNNKIWNNYVHDVRVSAESVLGSSMINGIYLDNYSDYVEVANNYSIRADSHLYAGNGWGPHLLFHDNNGVSGISSYTPNQWNTVLSGMPDNVAPPDPALYGPQ